MKNALVIDRKRYDMISHTFMGIPSRLIQFLDFLIIEEQDGSATMVKNRYDGVIGEINQEEYEAFKTAMSESELRDDN